MSNKTNCINLIKTLAEYYNLKGDPRKYAYLRALNSLQTLGDEYFKSDTDFTTLSGVGISINEKLRYLISTGDYPASVKVSLKEYAELKRKVSVNPHKHYMDRVQARFIIRDKASIEELLLRTGFDYEFTGSYRRGNTIVGDMDMVIFGMEATDIDYFIEYLSDCKDVRLTAKGYKKLKLVFLDGNSEILEMDIRFCNHEEKGTMLLYYTGPAEFNIRMRAKAKSMDLKLSEYGITDLNTNEFSTYETEKEIFVRLGLNYLAPCER